MKRANINAVIGNSGRSDDAVAQIVLCENINFGTAFQHNDDPVLARHVNKISSRDR